MHSATIGAGQVSVGGVESTTVTVVAQEDDSPRPSVHVSVTSRVPRPYGPPGVCTQVTASPSGSLEPLFTEAVAPHTAPAVAVALWQRATGAWLGGGAQIASAAGEVCTVPVGSTKLAVMRSVPVVPLAAYVKVASPALFETAVPEWPALGPEPTWKLMVAPPMGWSWPSRTVAVTVCELTVPTTYVTEDGSSEMMPGSWAEAPPRMMLRPWASEASTWSPPRSPEKLLWHGPDVMSVFVSPGNAACPAGVSVSVPTSQPADSDSMIPGMRAWSHPYASGP